MARIVVFGAAGKAGTRIVAEAASRGHQVTAVARDVSKLGALPPGVRASSGDVTDRGVVDSLAEEADAIVVAVGLPDEESYLRAVETVTQAASALGEQGPYILHMGGGASLLDADGVRHFDSPHFPPQFRPLAAGQVAALDAYRASTGAAWTYLSPPPVHFAPGERTGTYRTGLDQPVVDSSGTASISYEDYAVALVDEIERPAHRNTRFTVGY